MSATRRTRPRSTHRAPAGEVVGIVAALVLVIVMFALEWYGLAGIPGRSAPYRTVNGWHALSDLRWLMLGTVIAAVVTPVLHAIVGPSRAGRAAVCALAGITALLLVYRVLIEPPDPNAVLDQKLGAYLGLLAAVAIAFGSYDAARAAGPWRAQPRISG